MSTIKQYLDDLDDELRVSLWRRQRILGEVRAHLEQSAAAAREGGAAQEEAEQRAIATFGSVQEVAGGFAAEPTGVLNKTAVAVSDFTYRVWRQPGKLVDLAWWPAALLVLSWWGFGSDSFVWMAACSYGGLLFFSGWHALRPLPREGYVRRWRKLDEAGRRQTIAALRKGKAATQPPAADVALEVRQRVRSLRSPVHVACRVLVLILASAVGGAVLASDDVPLKAVVLVGVAAAAVITFDRRDWRAARRRVAAELDALEVVEQVAGDALRHGSTRLQEQQEGSRFWFELAPENAAVCPLSLEVTRRAFRLWAGDHDCRRHEIRLSDADHLHQLSQYLNDLVSAWPPARRSAPVDGR